MPAKYEYGSHLYWLWAWGDRIDTLVHDEEWNPGPGDWMTFLPCRLANDALMNLGIEYPLVLKQVDQFLDGAKELFKPVSDGRASEDEVSEYRAALMTLSERIAAAAKAIGDAQAKAESDNPEDVDADEPDNLYPVYDAATTLNALARDFHRYFTRQTFSTDEWCAEQQAKLLVTDAEAIGDRLRRALDDWQRLPGLFETLCNIKYAYGDRIVPVEVNGTSCTTAHEAAETMAEACLNAWRGAVPGDNARESFEIIRERFEALTLADLFGRIEAEYFATCRWLDEESETDAGGDLEEDEEEIRPSSTGMPWKEAARRMEELRRKGETFTSQPKLADQLGCSPATVNKAIKATPSLQEWARPVEAPPKARSLNDVVLDNSPQGREVDPNEHLDDDEADIVQRRLIEEAPEEQRGEIQAALANVPPEERKRILAQYADRDDHGFTILGRKP